MAKQTTEVANMTIRRKTLLEIKEAIDTEGHFGECDDCHGEARVIEDPDTAGLGNYELCKRCIAQRIDKITSRISNT